MTNLASQHCAPCRVGDTPLKGTPLAHLVEELSEGWQVIGEHHLEKEYRFSDFRQALEFTIRVGELADREGHHPNVFLAWGKVRLTLWTHKVDGVTTSDFILATKADEAFDHMESAATRDRRAAD